MNIYSLFVPFCLLLGTFLYADRYAARFTPPPGKILVFAGQDNESTGGTLKYRDGYVDNIGIPAGITHYVYFAEGWTNKFGRTFARGKVDGLNSETEWAAGPMNQKAYLDSPTLDRCVMHLSISMEGNSEDKVADGSYDYLIEELVDFVRDHPDHPFLIRIGYEFDGSWNNYDTKNFKGAFRRIVDALQKAKLTNFATVYASSSGATKEQFEQYDPGAEYYDWVGYSWWGGDHDGQAALNFARKLNKPVFIAEATPRGHFFDREDPQEVWNSWFKKFFGHIEENKDVIRAISYINANWEGQDMWKGDKWGQTRLETAPLLKSKWLEKMAEGQFVNAADKPFDLIGFPSDKARSLISGTYKDPSLPVEFRVEDLLKRMNLDEKVAQVTGWWNPNEEQLLKEGKIFDPDFYKRNCPHGIGQLGPLHNLTVEDDLKQYPAIQEYFRNQTRLGIPAIQHDEAAHGFMRFEANSFPSPIGLSCSWNPDLLTKIYDHAAREARSRGISHILSPIVDVARDLRWGRVDETLGEDPYLVSILGSAMVKGLQGSVDGTIDSQHVAATLKHFAGYAGTVGGRNRSPYASGRRQLLDIDVVPFRKIIHSVKPAAVMAAFNEIDGLPCHVNPWILKNVLRDRIGFKGLLVGDYQGIDLVRQYQRIGTSDADAARMAITAGLQQELPNNFGFQHLPRLIREGKVSEDLLDESVRSVLSLKFRLGLFEAPFQLDREKAFALSRSKKATELSLEAARQSIVLLRNDKQFLPLKIGDHKKIAIIGPNANICRLGNYSGRPLNSVTLIEGIRNHLGNSAEILFAEGCKIAHNDTGDSYSNWRYVNEVKYATLAENQELIAEARRIARISDLVILAIGENVLLNREAWGGNHVGDRSTLDLTESQKALARAVLDTGKPVVAFLNHSKPVTLNELGGEFKAILAGHYSGQQTGTAVAEILFGKTCPSGKLTLSWPKSVSQIPVHYSQQNSSLIFDYLDAPKGSEYPFGHGLSYTEFKYGTPQISSPSIRPGQKVSVSFKLTNTGNRVGSEVVQLYVSGENYRIGRPVLELKAFDRVSLKPGQTKNVSLELDADDLHFHDTDLKRVLPLGKYKIRVGGSSRSLSKPIDLKTIPERVSSGTETVTLNQGPLFAAPPRAKPQGLNVLFIAIDDLRPELGVYGSKVKTPHMDRLASKGMLFERAYCQQAVCGASRVSIMGGLYPSLTGEQTFHVSGWRNRHPNLLTLNQHFKEQGYQTIGMGKIYHGSSGAGVDPTHWNRWIKLHANGHYLKKENLEILEKALAEAKVGDQHDPPKGPMTESADVSDDAYIDGMRAQKTVELLEELSKGSDQPFFLAVGMSKPHLPFVAPKKYWDLYNRDDFKMPPNAGIPPGYPIHAANQSAPEMKKYSDFEGNGPKDFSKSTNRRLLHGYAAATSYVDACVGKIMDGLEKNGLAKNTIVVLWGDHGWKLGDHSSWCKHTNFECDTRVPLIVRDPRLKGGKKTTRLVELIDLYPTLCDLTNLPIPDHCQGRSFRKLLEDPEAGHRLDAYSSYPALKLMGHSIRFKKYRYTEWLNPDKNSVASVLTDLSADPGEETNVKDQPEYAEALKLAKERLQIRIEEAKKSTYQKSKSVTPAFTLKIHPKENETHQAVDGFGGSIAFWGTNPDQQAMQHAFKELKISILRAQGEVARKGIVDHNKEVLQRAMKINPDLEILLTFWQPRSLELQNESDWLQIVEGPQGDQYELKYAMEDAWADEIVRRTKQYLDWGINVTTLGVQNETNYSKVGSQTCIWDPSRLKNFIEKRLKPRLVQTGVNVKIAAPDLAYVGYQGSEINRFLPTIQSSAVDLVAYHMYDSYQDGMDGSISVLRENSRQIGEIRKKEFPKKGFWMTETTGAQWNNDLWHTYGWTPQANEFDKALLAAQYAHMTLVDAGANVFMWWGLIYSLAPDRETNPKVREKHRDEGLVLVQEQPGSNGRQKLIERTKKFFVLKQFINFIPPGSKRISIQSPEPLLASAYLSKNRKKGVIILINPSNKSIGLDFVLPAQAKIGKAFQTDRNLNCETIDSGTPLSPHSIRTILYSK
ncbi:MAG: glycoside hydrolase family 3 N-terminal domain-containing protein [Verrucomicrobiota bacterium]|nr:glycoside hydrolase family 3 N-terminal domain-containing protein [Verrucomicrobiota bacterium]